MSAPADHSPCFDRVVGSVRIRVLLRRWLDQLLRLAPASLGLIAVGLVIRLVFSPAIGLGLGWFALSAWVVSAAVLVWLQRPTLYQALALWDRSAGRREAFANAWWFEQQQVRTEAESRHMKTQAERLPDAVGDLARDLPVKARRWHVAPPAAMLVVLLVSAWVSPEAVLWKIDEQMAGAAEAEAKKLAETEIDRKKLESLTEEEKKAIEELEKKLQAAAEQLADSAGKDAREVLRDLERRAREAEDLAKQLGDDRDAWASDALVEELRRHADTADLGDAVAAKKADRAAAEADDLASQLGSSDLTEETRERMNETLQKVMGQAEEADRNRLVGGHVMEAAEDLAQQDATAAGQEFQQLAERMRDLRRRQQTRDELQKIADQLRQSGNNIAGQNEAGAMQEMAGAGQQSGQGSEGDAPQVEQAQAGAGQSSLMPPGLNQMNSQPGAGQGMPQAPVPGTGESRNIPMLSQAPEGSGQGGEGAPMMMAPVPGSDPDQVPDAFMLGQGQPPNGASSMAFMIPGSNKPGIGKAELEAEATEKIDTSNSSMVTARPGSEGQSTVRAVEGGVRQENASRSATEEAVEFLAAQEEALDEAALPPARREQVRRYFTELRKRFEPSASR
jgi:hypothetical protein